MNKFYDTLTKEMLIRVDITILNEFHLKVVTFLDFTRNKLKFIPVNSS